MIERRDCNALSPQRHLEDSLCDDDWIRGSHSELSELDLHSGRCSAHSTCVRRGDLVIQSDRLSICTRKHPGSLPGGFKRPLRCGFDEENCLLPDRCERPSYKMIYREAGKAESCFCCAKLVIPSQHLGQGHGD